jgi:uncharacterized membrane protein (DUF485 family)
LTLQQRQHRQLRPQEWDAITRDPEFRTLLARKRRFIVPATIFFIAYYFALPVLVGFAPGLMSRPAIGPVPIAYIFALSQFAMAWILMALYLRRSRGFDVAEGRIVTRVRTELAQ